MKLEITENTLLKQIQYEFNKIYPFLWIDFYYNSISRTNHTIPERIGPNAQIKNLCKLKGTKVINIDGEISISQLETDFWETLGLKTKILRKSGNVWVGTIFTGNWTLENQNSAGKQIVID